MNEYFVVRMNTEPNIIGVTNGIKQADITRDGFKNPANYDVLLETLGSRNYWDIRHLIAEMQFDVEYVKLLQKAIRTDFLLFGPALINCEYLISSKVAAIFDRCKLHKVHRFPACVVDQIGVEHSYDLPHVDSISDSLIDFNRSVYYTGSVISGKKSVTFRDADEKNEFSAKTSGLKLLKLFLNDRFDRTIDLFATRNFGELIISGNLKNQLIAAAATGPVFLPTSTAIEGEIYLPWI